MSEELRARVARAWSVILDEYGHTFGNLDNSYSPEVEDMIEAVRDLSFASSAAGQREGWDWYEPHLGAPTKEPSLRSIVLNYYAPHFSDEEAQQLTDAYFEALASPSAPEERRDAVYDAVRGIGDDYMTSEVHHPGYVLIPTAKFDAIVAALGGASNERTDEVGQLHGRLKDIVHRETQQIDWEASEAEENATRSRLCAERRAEWGDDGCARDGRCSECDIETAEAHETETSKAVREAGQRVLAAIAASPSAPEERRDEVERLRDILDTERYKVAIGIQAVKRAVDGRKWLSEPGRGSYTYDDERYQQEFGAALDEIDAALEPLRKIAGDWSECPRDPLRVAANRSAALNTVSHGGEHG